ncbi:hypothetical protein CRV01_06470 [Arcobacter sp. CECT 8983]|uniref:TonB family protein n=1 Tax=Arcobacter sp. CECT 8983 TaxID=2044508 RepID=UPI00100B7F10|nr:TonB family protein [Arcobacter sp. CECT 8983]RXJ90788.1 hypothetical protein CRV01_06470 [Arcobacter sp. CECT 8983]
MQKKLYIFLLFSFVAIFHFLLLNYEFNKEIELKRKNISHDITDINLVRLEKKQEIISKAEQVRKKQIEEQKQNEVAEKVIKNKKKIIKKKGFKKEKIVKKQIEKNSKDKIDQKELIKKEKENSLEKEHIKLYIGYVRRVIENNKFYPNIAKAMNLQGECLVRLKILNDGKIQDIEFEKKTRYKVLNSSTLKILKNIEKFKAFPKEISREYLTLRLPIKYRLKG